MGVQESFEKAAEYSFHPPMHFSKDPVLEPFTFVLEDRAAAQALEEAHKSGLLKRSVRALESCGLLDQTLGVIWGRTLPMMWMFSPPLLLHGMDKNHQYLEVTVGSERVSFHEDVPEHTPSQRGPKPVVCFFAFGMSAGVS